MQEQRCACGETFESRWYHDRFCSLKRGPSRAELEEEVKVLKRALYIATRQWLMTFDEHTEGAMIDDAMDSFIKRATI